MTRGSLGTRMFVVTAVLVAVSVGVAVLVTAVLGNRIADRAAREALLRASTAQSSLELQRFDQLRLIARVFVDEPAIVAYLAERDSPSTLDLLEERQETLLYDFAIVLDPDGRVVARTDDPDSAGADLSDSSLVRAALETFEAYGIWEERGRLYEAVAVPLGIEYLEGFLIAGFALDDGRADEVRTISGADVGFLARDENGRPMLAAGTVDPLLWNHLGAALGEEGEALRTVLEEGKTIEHLVLDLGGHDWIAHLRPLADATGTPVGIAISLASLEEELASYQEIERVLLLVGVIAVLVASALSFTLARRTLQPVRALAEVATAAAEGDYDRRTAIDRDDEVGSLAKAFDTLLSELREKRDMEAYVTELARTMPDRQRVEAAPAEALDAVVLGLELPRYASRVGLGPEDTLQSFGTDLRRVGRAIRAHDGTVVGVLGLRVLAIFRGERRSRQALAAAAEIMGTVGAPADSMEEPSPPTLVLAIGRVVTGSVTLDEDPEAALVGLPLRMVDTLLREASPGDILLSRELHRELETVFEDAGLELVSQRGLISTQALYRLDARMAARVTGVAGGLGELPTLATVEGERMPAAGGDTLSGIHVGSLIGERFEILSVLGAGGMGVVYKVRDRELDDLVALKMLKPGMWSDQTQLERLKDELKLARKITHANVLRTFDFGDVDGVPFITMEFVRGITLKSLLEQTHRLPYSAGLRIVRQLCRGLMAAHEQGVIHRDIKPENLIVEPTGNAKLMDFGIARPVRRIKPGQTSPGMIVGTPHYLAPEQVEGKEPDERADIYACGVVLFEIFTGRLPFTGATAVEVLMHHLNDPPPAPRELWPEMPEALEAIILRCLEKDVERRYRRVDGLLADLEDLRS